MNNRDPFNLRRSSPLEYIQRGARFAATTANRLQHQITESTGFSSGSEDSVSKPHTPVSAYADGMSLAPRHVPSYSSEIRSRAEDGQWMDKRSPQASVTDKLGSMFGSQESLPMYKDKPYNYAMSQRRGPFYKRRRPLLIIFSAIIFFLFWISSGSPKKDRSSSLGAIFSGGSSQRIWTQRQEMVKDAFRWSWQDYEKHAWGFDEYHPNSKTMRNMAQGGLGWIIVDALDTLILMNLTTELTHARQWISTELDYEKDQDVNTFETTIRMLGGLLSAHYLSTEYPSMAPIATQEDSNEEELYIEKASDLANRLVAAFDSESGIPFASINLKTQDGIPSHADGGASSTAEAATLQLEFKYLAKLTGEVQYWKAAEEVIQVIDNNGMEDGLLPIYIHPGTGTFMGSNIRLGSRGDSYYEYLIKQYLQTSKQEQVYLDMWNESLEGVKKHLITYSNPSNFTILAERPDGLENKIHPKMDHLVCFMPGTIALAATEGLTLQQARKRSAWGKQQEEDMQLAIELMKTCWATYKVTKTGLAPEITHFEIYDPPVMFKNGTRHSPMVLSEADDAEWHKDLIIKGNDAHNLQRPETAESLFYMWRITRDPIYREWGWQMFNAFCKHTLTKDGSAYSSITNVEEIPPPSKDNMESFWLAETLKYFYLLFGPEDVLPLDKNVFNTEAHPFPVVEMGRLFSTGWKRLPRDAEGKVVKPAQPQAPTDANVQTESSLPESAHQTSDS